MYWVDKDQCLFLCTQRPACLREPFFSPCFAESGGHDHSRSDPLWPQFSVPRGGSPRCRDNREISRLREILHALIHGDTENALLPGVDGVNLSRNPPATILLKII